MSRANKEMHTAKKKAKEKSYAELISKVAATTTTKGHMRTIKKILQERHL
jgi:hypothetical protein